MNTEELDRLRDLFSNSNRWCKNAEARSARGVAVRYGDPDAVAWDLTGGLCLLFGWRRACDLFRQIDRHLNRHRSLRWRVQDPHIESMLALQEFNDGDHMNHQTLMERLASMPVSDRPAAFSEVHAHAEHEPADVQEASQI